MVEDGKGLVGVFVEVRLVFAVDILLGVTCLCVLVADSLVWVI